MRQFILLIILIHSILNTASAQTAEGGGAYIQNSGKLLNCVVTTNYATDGFGISGSTGSVYNCNVFKNKYLNKVISHPGDMVMTDGTFITPVYQGTSPNQTIQFPTGYSAANVTSIVFYSNTNNNYLNTLLWVVSVYEGYASWQPNASPSVTSLYIYTVPETAVYDLDGKNNTDKIIAQSFSSSKTNTNCAATYCRNLGVDWYLPALGQLKELLNNYITINTVISALNRSDISPKLPLITNNNYWSSTRGQQDGASWYLSLLSKPGDYSSANSTNPYYVRAIKNILSSN